MSLSRIIAVAALGGLGYAYSEWTGSSAKLTAADAMLAVAIKDLATTRADLSVATEVNQANLAALAAVKADNERQAQIAARAQQAANKRASDLKTALKRIKDAPKSEDGPIAPVLRRELDDLRADSVRPDGTGDAPADPVDPDPSGAPAVESGKPDLQQPAANP